MVRANHARLLLHRSVVPRNVFQTEFSTELIKARAEKISRRDLANLGASTESGNGFVGVMEALDDAVAL
jgi:hypothetical protein